MSTTNQQQTRHEFYAQQEPNGRVVTTKSRTTYAENNEDRRVFECGPGTINDRYCCQPEGILRIAQIAVALIIVSLITAVFGPGPFKGILFGQTILMVFDGVAMCITFIFLVVYFLNLHETHLNFWPWAYSDYLFSMIASVSFFILGIIEAYYSTGVWANNCNDVGADGFFCFVNAILYAFGALLVKRTKKYGNTEQNY